MGEAKPLSSCLSDASQRIHADMIWVNNPNTEEPRENFESLFHKHLSHASSLSCNLFAVCFSWLQSMRSVSLAPRHTVSGPQWPWRLPRARGKRPGGLCFSTPWAHWLVLENTRKPSLKPFSPDSGGGHEKSAYCTLQLLAQKGGIHEVRVYAEEAGTDLQSRLTAKACSLRTRIRELPQVGAGSDRRAPKTRKTCARASPELQCNS